MVHPPARVSETPPLSIQFDEHAVDAIFAPTERCHFPGAAVGVSLAGLPIYRKGFGLASMELPLVLTPSTRMRIGSVTKQFTCLAFLLLCESDNAAVDEPIGAYLPELSPVVRSATARQLMGHTSGLRDSLDICLQLNGIGRHVTASDLMAPYLTEEDVNALPGTSWSYNNGGYVLLSTIIERISGEPLEEFLRKRIFQPVGMHDTRLRRSDDDFVANSASLHYGSQSDGFTKLSMGTEWTGEGGIVSTINDMLRWLAHMDTPVVGTQSTWNLMRNPQALADGALTGYGFGLFLDCYRGAPCVRHAGGVLSGTAEMIKVPAVGLDVIVITNRGDLSATDLAERVLESCISGLSPAVHMGELPIATGTFRSPTSGRVIQLFDKGGKQALVMDGMEIPVESDEQGVLHPSSFWRLMPQAISLLGQREHPSSVRFESLGTIDELPLAGSTSPAALDLIAGHYRSDPAAADAHIFVSADKARLVTTGKFGSAHYELELLADNLWRAIPLDRSFIGGTLFFASGASAFDLRTFRTARLPFGRLGMRSSP